jgi:hypothetical protein
MPNIAPIWVPILNVYRGFGQPTCPYPFEDKAYPEYPLKFTGMSMGLNLVNVKICYLFFKNDCF